MGQVLRDQDGVVGEVQTLVLRLSLDYLQSWAPYLALVQGVNSKILTKQSQRNL